jgi:hypothetical protein
MLEVKVIVMITKNVGLGNFVDDKKNKAGLGNCEKGCPCTTTSRE